MAVMSTTGFYAAGNLSSSIAYTFNEPRTLSQVLSHFVVLRIGATIALLHSTSLQQAPIQERAQAFLLFIFLPTFPLASIICRLVYCLNLANTKPWPTDRSGYLIYLVSAILGVHTRTESDPSRQGLESGATAIKPKLYETTNSSFLLSHEFSDFERQKCSCTSRICRRFKARSFLGTLVLLSIILLHCTISLFLYIRRCSHTYVEMVVGLLQGSPPGSKEAEIYADALETISGFDQLNAVWALGGMAAATSALVLKITGWVWQEVEVGNKSGRKCSDAPKLLQVELPVSLFLYVFFTRQSWARVLPEWNSVNPIQTLLLTFGMLGIGFYAVYVTFCWVRGRAIWKKVPTGASVFVVWIMFVTQWPVVYAMLDVWELNTCLIGDSCPLPLLLWKDRWSDFWWMY